MGFGGTFRRWRADPVVASGTMVTVALSLVLLAAGPVYSDAVAVGALRRSLVAEPAENTTVELSARSRPADVELVESIAIDALDAAFGPVDHEVFPLLVSGESFEMPDQPDPVRTDLAWFAWLDALHDHVDVIDGRLPGDGDAGGAVEVAVHDRAAAELGLDIGRRLSVVPRSGTAEAVTIEVVGRYTVPDELDAFWTGRERLASALTETSDFRTVTLVAPKSSMIDGVSTRPQVEVLAVPDFTRIRLDDVQPLRRRLSGLDRTLQSHGGQLELDPPLEFEIASSVTSALADVDRTLTVGRSIVLAVVLQLAVLGAFSLVLVAGLGVDARRAESAMLRARGASATQLVAQAAFEGATIVAPLAVLAPWLAVGLVDRFDEAGSLRENGLRLDPEPVAEAWLVVALAAVITVVLLAWPALRTARAADAARPRSRRRLSGVVQRSGLDLALLAVVAVSYWQLRTLGDARAATVRGRFGVDPLLAAAPTFGLVAGAFLALRVVPAGARMLERSLASTRRVVPALVAWQLARRPHRYSRSALLLIMAISIGTFAVAYDATWTTSQARQAAHEIGADGRLEPNRRTGDSIGWLQLRDVIEGVDGVDVAMPVVRETAGIAASERTARFLAVDSGRPEMLRSGGASSRGLTTALSALRDRRPQVDGIVLPASAVTVELAAEVAPDPPPDDSDEDEDEGVPAPEPPPPFVASVTIVVIDGDGVIHRLGAGNLEVDGPTPTVDLTVPIGDGSVGGPVAPLSVISIELAYGSQRAPSREIDVRLGPITVTEVDGSVAVVPLRDSDLVLDTDVLGFVDQRPSMAHGSGTVEDGVALTLVTGSSFNVVQVVHGLNARVPLPPAELAGVGASGWMVDAGVEVGDVMGVTLGRADTVRVVIVGAIDAVPGIDPTTTDGLLLDLPSLLWFEREPGRPVRDVSEFWFSADADSSIEVSAFSRPPIEAVSVSILRDRRAELVSDPAAIGALGALTLGFGAAAAFALAAFVVTAAISARERRSEFALLEALGLAARQRRRWMLVEQAVLAGLGLVLGTLLGWSLSRLILPVVSLTQDGSSVYPPVTVVIPWHRVVALEAVVVAALVIGVAVAGALHGRAAIAATLRGGDDG